MAKQGKGPTKAQVKAAADRAEEKAALNRKSAPAAKPERAPVDDTGGAQASAGGVTTFIKESHLNTLMKQCLSYQGEVSTASGNMGDLIRDAAANKHLHRGAFSDNKKLLRMGKKDPGKLWLHLAHFDYMRKALRLDELAGAQGQLVESGAGDDDDQAENQDGGQPKAPSATVSRPKFGAGHPNFGDGNKQVIKDAVAGTAADKVADIAKAAGANTPG